MLDGEPSAILDNLGQDHLRWCSGDAKEIIAASFGLMELMGEGEDGLNAVRVEIARRPGILAVIAAWLAYTPFIGNADKLPSGFDVDKFSFKDPEKSAALDRITPEQRSIAYGKAVLGAVAVLLCAVGGGRSMRPHVRQHFVGSRHFRNCVLRLVALVGAYQRLDTTATSGGEANDAGVDERRVGNHLALVSRDALCALCKEHRPCLDLVDKPLLHPFNPDATARSLVAAIPLSGSPLQMPKEGARHPDDPFTMRDYAQTAATLMAVLLALRYLIWPAVYFVCMHVFSLPGLVLQWAMQAVAG